MCMHPKSLLFFSILTSVINNIFLLQYLAETTGLIDARSPSPPQAKQCTTATATITQAQAKRVQELSRDVSRVYKGKGVNVKVGYIVPSEITKAFHYRGQRTAVTLQLYLQWPRIINSTQHEAL